MILSAPQCRSFIIVANPLAPLNCRSTFWSFLIYLVPYSAPLPLYIYIYAYIVYTDSPCPLQGDAKRMSCPLFYVVSYLFFHMPPPFVFVFFIILIYNLLWHSFEIRILQSGSGWAWGWVAQQDAATMWHTIPRKQESRILKRER